MSCTRQAIAMNVPRIIDQFLNQVGWTVNTDRIKAYFNRNKIGDRPKLIFGCFTAVASYPRSALYTWKYTKTCLAAWPRQNSWRTIKLIQPAIPQGPDPLAAWLIQKFTILQPWLAAGIEGWASGKGIGEVWGRKKSSQKTSRG